MEQQEATGAVSTFDFANHKFQIPNKKIDDNHTHELFKKSDACNELLSFIAALTQAVQNSRMTETPLTDNLRSLYGILNTLEQWVDEIPPVQQPMRFGNKAFRTWLDRVNQSADEQLSQLCRSEGFGNALPEIKAYFLDSFGSYERIDYGTGHELNFVVFLLCLFKLKIYRPDDFKAVINQVFQKYLTLMRKIQLIYVLEPAGSHGVWGLDDYQHLAFLFGASQLVKSDSYLPESIHSESALIKDSDDYMYFGCIRFIKQVKKGVPFGESSPILNDVSGVPSWEKVCTGMMKMFQAEVIGKLPVIKHLKFGSLLQFNP